MWNLIFGIVGFGGLLLICVVIRLLYLRVRRFFICPKCKHLRKYPKCKSKHDICIDCENAEKHTIEIQKQTEVRYQKWKKLKSFWLDEVPVAQSIEEVKNEFKPTQILNSFQHLKPREGDTIMEVLPICDAINGLAANVAYYVDNNELMRHHWWAWRFINSNWKSSIENSYSNEGRNASKPLTYDFKIWHLFSDDFYYNQIGVYVDRNYVRRINNNVAFITIFGKEYQPD